MLKLNRKYLVFLSVLIGIYFLLLYFMPQKFNWFVSLYQKDKNPFGAMVFKSLMDHSWFTQINTSNKTLYELEDLKDPGLLILCQGFKISNSGIEALYDLAENGKTVLISAHEMDTTFTNGLGVKINDLSFNFYLDRIWGEDSLGVKFSTPPFDTNKTFWLPEQLLPQYFEEFDTSNCQILAQTTNDEAILLKIAHGAGSIILSSTPLVFTNFSMMHEDNHEFVSGMMSFMPEGALHWTEYYQLGRMEAQTPLRYVLSEPSLKWAFFILLVSILILMVFEAKRVQRVIPVIAPLKNETLGFVKTISHLYYQKKDHKGLAVKKMLHFTEYLKQRLQVDVDEDISDVIKKVAAKTGAKESEVKLLFDQMNYINTSSYISSKELKLFMERVDALVEERT